MKFVALDLETTWLNKDNDSIIEIALLKYENFVLVDEFCSLINPWFSIPEEISYITWIYDNDVENAPTIISLREKIKDFIGDSIIVWHNVGFDVWFLNSYWIDCTYNYIVDTFELSQILLYKEKSLSLTSICTSLWFHFENAHRAKSDTLATVWLLEKLVDNLRNLSFNNKKILFFIYSLYKEKSSFSIIIEEFLSDELIVPDFEEIESLILSKVWKYKKEEIIVNKELSVDIFWVLWNNAIKESNIEDREEQNKMIKIIDESFKNKDHSIIEAPTWIWKTFAYLIPAILHSVKTGSQIIISTNTKWLQDQIVYKDIPKLKQIFTDKNIEIDFLYSKVKWRKNYLSLIKFFEFINNNNKEKEEIIFIGKLLFWLLETDSWELDELNYYSKEFLYLKEVNAWDKRVLSNINPYKNQEFLYKARNNSKSSNIIIVNHSLLFQDTQNESSSILPKISNLIIDEAHNLEASITDALKKHCSYSLCETNLQILEIILKQNNKVIWGNLLSLDKFFEIKESILMHVGIIFDFFETYIDKKNDLNQERNQREYLIMPDLYNDKSFPNILNISNSLDLKIQTLLDLLYSVWDEVFEKIEGYLKELEEYMVIIKEILKNEKDSNFIKVVYKDERNWVWVFHTLLNAWSYLKENLWSKLDSSILTSATFKIWDSFDFIVGTLGLSDFTTHELKSDFDYSKQALVYIPSDIWDIRSLIERKRVNDFIKDIICAVWWRTLCLFTSFLTIKEAFLQIFPDLKKLWINLLVQWLWWGKYKLLENFKLKSSNSVLFWTDSFWEWVDIPGSDLEMLIIYKFPFMVPSDPVFQARSKLYKDSFYEYSLPNMILKFKQWLWRLIRTKNDKWIIVVLDKRIDSAWWDIVKNSFPDWINIKSWDTELFLKLLNNKYS